MAVAGKLVQQLSKDYVPVLKRRYYGDKPIHSRKNAPRRKSLRRGCTKI